MNAHHLETIHTDSIRAAHMHRAEQHRRALPRPARTGAVVRLRAMVVAFRRPELVATTRPRAATAPRGC